MTAGDRAYGWLLLAYPPAFRVAFGREMRLIFNDQYREVELRGGSRIAFWAGVIADVARSAIPLRIEALVGLRMSITLREVEMLIMAILAVMVGALEAAGAFTEFWSALQHPRGAGPWVIASSLGMVAGGLVLSSGVALLRGSPGAVPLTRAAAVTSILVVLLISYAVPMMGFFSQILGIGFPIVLLLFLRGRRDDWHGLGRDPQPA